MRVLAVVVLSALLALRGQAQGALVSGVVRDSLAGAAPVRGAVVQLVAIEPAAAGSRTVFSDTLGRFAIPDVPDGRYLLGFFHPMLDSLGFEPPPREVTVARRRPVRADLGIPGAGRVRAAICGAAAVGAHLDSGAVVLGFVRDARGGAPPAGVTMAAEWQEYIIAPGGVQRQLRRVRATPAASGWYLFCDVPSPGAVTLVARREADSTVRIDLDLPATGFYRRDLFVGASGNEPLRGAVRTADGGRPIVGAEVILNDSLRARVDERGQWVIPDAPLGTRMLQVRAVGYFPERRAVDVITGAPPIETALMTVKAMLDTVKVSAERQMDRHRSGFTDRRRTGAGTYLTAADIARRNVRVLSDVFKTVRGVTVERDSIRMRGMFDEVQMPTGGRCVPAFYIDGMLFPDIGSGDLDDMLHAEEVIGIEVYTAVSLPPQFSRGLHGGGCGAIVIWTK